MTASHYQLLIVGGGPAGLTAGLYAARARITTLLIEKAALGGQVTSPWSLFYHLKLCKTEF